MLEKKIHVFEQSSVISIQAFSIQVDSIQIEVVSRHHQSGFDSTQHLCSQLFSGSTGAKTAIPVRQ